MTSFYRGSGIIALGCLPSHAIYFMNYEFLKSHFNKLDRFSVLMNMAIGGLSTIFHDLIMTPCEMLKQRSHINPTFSYIQIIKEIYKNEGIKAYWRSFPVNFLNNLPNSMCIVSVNEGIKDLIKKRKETL